jgi:translation initiation factor IF-3
VAKEITPRIEKSIGEIAWERHKYTSTMAAAYFLSLQEVSARTQIPVARLLDQAVFEYLKMLGVQLRAAAPVIDIAYIQSRIKEVAAE